jgi:hypothetical protein
MAGERIDIGLREFSRADFILEENVRLGIGWISVGALPRVLQATHSFLSSLGV